LKIIDKRRRHRGNAGRFPRSSQLRSAGAISAIAESCVKVSFFSFLFLSHSVHFGNLLERIRLDFVALVRTVSQLRKNRGVNTMNRRMNEQEIRNYDDEMKAKYRGFDVFFVESAAAILDVSRRTFQNYGSTDGGLGFVLFLKDGGVATCTASLQAYKAQRVDRRQGAKPTYQFRGG
jgi:hypothetical protein